MTDFMYGPYDDGEMKQLSVEEMQALNLRELSDYEEKVPMTEGERKALRKWVASGHSVQEHPDSRYVCLYGSWPPPDFLSVYRMDKEIRKNLKGKTKEEQQAYLQEYVGYSEASEADKKWRSDRQKTPEKVKTYIRKLERELFYLWMFLSQEELYDEARSFVEEYEEEPIPFEFE